MCSIKDTAYNKGYALTIKNGNNFEHNLIIHKIGQGFFYNAEIYRGDIANDIFIYQSSYPTIIHLLEDQISV